MADPKITIRVEGSGLPGGGSDGQVLTRRDGKAVWGDLDIDGVVLDLMIRMGIAPVMADGDDTILTDGDGAVLITA